MDRFRSRKSIFLLFVAGALLWFDAGTLYRVTRPTFTGGTVGFPAQPAQAFTHPFHLKKAAKARFILKENLELSRWHPVVFTFYPQDTLWALKVNGHELISRVFPLSVVDHAGRSISLSPYLHPGHNELEFDLQDYWGEASLNLYASPWDIWSLIIMAFVLLATSTSGTLVFVTFGIRIAAAEVIALLGGFLLRYIYVLGTPYFIRAYDWWGHEAYLEDVIRHLKLPDPHSGWESYQPPLYYFLLGAGTRVLLLVGMSWEQRYVVWQAFSLLCSAGTLLAGFWIGRLLYPNEIRQRLYLLAVIAVAPALVFNASRMSNDVLLNLLEFLWLAFLLRYWKRPDWPSWLGLSLVLGLALLTKASALALIPVSLLCLRFASQGDMKTSAPKALLFLAGVIGIAGWYYLPRTFHEYGIDSYLVGNIHQLNPKGHIDGIFAKSLVFNPFKVLRYPFVEPWGPRHEYFLEYFFKSIFLGEWLMGHVYRWIARAFILTALFLVPVLLQGVWTSLKNRTGYDLPLLVTFFGIFASQWSFVQVAPYMSSQDFRYSVILLVPFAYFFVRGVSRLSDRWRQVTFFGLQILILDSVIYLIEVALEG